MARRPLWFLSLPIAAGGCLLGHVLGYRLARAGRGDQALHGYLAYAPLFLAACLSLILVALALRVAGRLRGRPAVWPFALLPLLAFATQELLERVAAGLPPTAVAEPAVLTGLLAQLPLALLAFALARTLLSCADAVRRALAGPRRLRLRPALLLEPAGEPAPPRTSLAFDRLGRAPPRR